jgi:hypothetical protein
MKYARVKYLLDLYTSKANLSEFIERIDYRSKDNLIDYLPIEEKESLFYIPILH